MTDTSTQMLDTALVYAKYGWKVFPVFGVAYGNDGKLRCTCGSPTCSEQNAGKHPATRRGHKDASVDEVQIRSWWAARPDANIGIATGAESGIFVVDVDVKKGDGPASLAGWWAEVGEEGWTTLAERSGSGGQHYFFEYPQDGESVPGRIGWLPSVDVKSDGGYVVVAPSRILAGDYAWTTSGIAPAYPSNALLAAIREGTGRSTGEGGGTGAGFAPEIDELAFVLNGADEGKRNHTFFHYAIKWLHQFKGDQKLVLGLIQIAYERMDESKRADFTTDEVYKLFRSAFARYQNQKNEDVLNDAWIRTWLAGSGEGEAVEGGAEGGRRSLPPPEPLNIVTVEGGLMTAPDGFPLTDVGNSQRLLAVYGPYVRHTNGIGWMAWDGTRWSRELGDKTLMRYSMATIRSLLVDFIPKMREHDMSDEVIKRMMTWWRNSESSGRIKAAVSLSEEKADWPYNEWDRHDELFNCTNGTLNVLTGEFRPHAPDDYMTKMGGVRYVEDAEAWRWRAFMERMLPDPDVRWYVQKAVGYSMTGLVDEKCFFILHGPGNNGKTMFTQTIGYLMGEYWNAAPKSIFVGWGSKEESHPTDLASVAGARYITPAVEITRSDHLAEARIKSMTGGNTMKARFMHQDFFEFEFKGKLWLDTNYKPRLSDFSDALQERLRLIPWEVRIEPAERRGRSEVISEFMQELSGILWWALEGAAGWRREGLKVPAGIEEATTLYVDAENLVAQFARDYLVFGDGVERFCTSKDLMKAYTYWLSEQGYNERAALSPRTLGSELKRLGIEDGRGTRAERGWKVSLTVQVPAWV